MCAQFYTFTTWRAATESNKTCYTLAALPFDYAQGVEQYLGIVLITLNDAPLNEQPGFFVGRANLKREAWVSKRKLGGVIETVLHHVVASRRRSNLLGIEDCSLTKNPLNARTL
jgi:hypothetical protein